VSCQLHLLLILFLFVSESSVSGRNVVVSVPVLLVVRRVGGSRSGGRHAAGGSGESGGNAGGLVGALPVLVVVHAVGLAGHCGAAGCSLALWGDRGQLHGAGLALGVPVVVLVLGVGGGQRHGCGGGHGLGGGDLCLACARGGRGLVLGVPVVILVLGVGGCRGCSGACGGLDRGGQLRGLPLVVLILLAAQGDGRAGCGRRSGQLGSGLRGLLDGLPVLVLLGVVSVGRHGGAAGGGLAGGGHGEGLHGEGGLEHGGGHAAGAVALGAHNLSRHGHGACTLAAQRRVLGVECRLSLPL